MEKGNEMEINRLFETVVKGGYCVGCGACAAVKDSPVEIKLNQHAMYEATLKEGQTVKGHALLAKVCPFSDQSQNEYVIGKELYGKQAVKNDKLGYHLATYAGYVVEGGYREKGSSGGMGSWILTELLRKGLVDGVIHVKEKVPSENDPTLFSYTISHTTEDIEKGSKSRYYPIEMSGVLKMVRDTPGRYAIVGLPCFIKSIRLISKYDPVLKERIKFCVGLVCGHLKSARFAEMMAWECGIKPDGLKKIDFRTKLEKTAANRYGVTVNGLVDGRCEEIISPPVSEMYGTNWGLGFFKYKACDYCDDVVAETADITIGDAWLPQYVSDTKGTNVIVIRDPVIQELIQNAQKEGRVHLDHVNAGQVIQSQKSGFNHRRTGLSYRLYLSDRIGEWRPKKRVKASRLFLDTAARKKQLLRVEMAAQSHIAFAKAMETNLFSTFMDHMEPYVIRHKQLYKTGWLIGEAKNLKKKLVDKLNGR